LRRKGDVWLIKPENSDGYVLQRRLSTQAFSDSQGPPDRWKFLAVPVIGREPKRADAPFVK
jgi:hypothetical protein